MVKLDFQPKLFSTLKNYTKTDFTTDLMAGIIVGIFADRTEGTSKMSGGIFGEAFFGVLALPFRTIARKK